MRPLTLIAALAASLAASAAPAVTCEDTTFDDTSYTICHVDPAADDLRLFLQSSDGQLYSSFSAVQADHPDARLAFAMNGGMFRPDRSPAGLYVEPGRQVMRLVTNDGPGNFGLLPNGVFCIGQGWARVEETLAFEAEAPDCRYATQSGPMLVIDGALHPRFLPRGTSRHIRNGVGTSADGSEVVFAISNEPVNFYTFARLFRDHLGLPDALYLDGSVSRLHAPGLGRSDFGRALGPIVGVLAPVDGAGAGG